MKIYFQQTLVVGLAVLLVVAVAASVSKGQATKSPGPAQVEQAVLARLAEIQKAAQALDPDKVFSFVLENDQGALAENGKLLRTRKDALESTRRGFRGLEKVNYQFDQQQITRLSATAVLAVGVGSSSATTTDGRTFENRFVQSVVLVLTNDEWKVLHAHRSFPSRQ